jgi:hypothetical protein
LLFKVIRKANAPHRLATSVMNFRRSTTDSNAKFRNTYHTQPSVELIQAAQELLDTNYATKDLGIKILRNATKLQAAKGRVSGSRAQGGNMWISVSYDTHKADAKPFVMLKDSEGVFHYFTAERTK